MASKLFRKALAEVKPETKIFVKKYLDLLERNPELLEEKEITQSDQANALEQQHKDFLMKRITKIRLSDSLIIGGILKN